MSMSEESDGEGEHKMDLALFFRIATSPVADDRDDGIVLGQLFHNEHVDKILDIKYNRDRGRDCFISERSDFAGTKRAKRHAMRRLGYILRQNSSLEKLVFIGHGHHAPGLSICVGLQHHHTIVHLDLWHIDLHGPGATHALAPFIADNPVLETLELKSCCLEPMDIWQLSYSLMQRSSSSLQEVNLNYNRVGDNCMQMLAMGVLHNRCIRRLSLADTGASGKAIRSLSWLLEKNESTLEELDLADNSMDTADALQLIKSLEKNNKLKTLTLKHRYSCGLKGNPLHWELISHRLLKLVCNDSSISDAAASNHTLSSVLEPHNEDDNLGFAFEGEPHPMLDLCHQSLDEDDANLLFASLVLNYKGDSGSVKARHKALWRHVRGDLYASDESIDIALMPRFLALLGRGYTSATHCEPCKKASAKLIQYQKVDLSLPLCVRQGQEEESETPPLDTVRLGAVYRAVRTRPQVCSEKSTELQACQRKLARSEAENERLRCELKALAEENDRLRSRIPLCEEK